MHLLLAEDERSLSKALVRILEYAHYTVDAVYDGQEALDYMEAEDYDGIILDIMMPEIDGIEVLRRFRALGKQTPVLLLTAKSEIDDKVEGLDSGANDYLTKPFDTKELLARIRAMTRIQTVAVDASLSFGNVSLNQKTFVLSNERAQFTLANKEYQIMELLMSNPGHVIATQRIFEKIWGYDSDTEINVVWVYISYLRKKLNQMQADILIKAHRNVGYSLEKKAAHD